MRTIQGEMGNNSSKLTEIDKRIEKDRSKGKEVEDDPNYSEKQRQLYRDIENDRKRDLKFYKKNPK